MYLLIVQALGLNDDREISRKDMKGGPQEQIHERIRAVEMEGKGGRNQ